MMSQYCVHFHLYQDEQTLNSQLQSRMYISVTCAIKINTFKTHATLDGKCKETHFHLTCDWSNTLPNYSDLGLGNVGHGEDLPYLIFYPGKKTDVRKYSVSDRFIQKRMIKLWTNFVKYL